MSEAVTIALADEQTKKRTADQAELEINLSAPEPPSKKALRKAKKAKHDEPEKEQKSIVQQGSKQGDDDVVPNSGKRSDYGIWIGNLAFTTTKQNLLDFMTGDSDNVIQQEKVTRINLPSGGVKFGKIQNKGFAYVDLADATAHQNALELSEKLLGGRRVLIKDAKSFAGRPKDSAKPAPSHPPSKRIFVGNLTFDTTADDLEEHFGVCGTIMNKQIATFQDSGKCKGYAWIEFEQLSSAQAAMRGWVETGGEEADGLEKPKPRRRIWLHKLSGRQLRMEFAEDPAARYQKRFGKKASQPEDSMTEVGESTEPNPVMTKAGPAQGDSRSDASAVPRKRNHREEKKPETGYAKETVQKLKGAIVESQGSRTTFD